MSWSGYVETKVKYCRIYSIVADVCERIRYDDPRQLGEVASIERNRIGLWYPQM